MIEILTMKKFLILLMSALTLFSAVSCASDGNMGATTTQAGTIAAPDNTNEPASPPEQATPPIEEPSVPTTPFYAGYSKINISPDRFPILMFLKTFFLTKTEFL